MKIENSVTETELADIMSELGSLAETVKGRMPRTMSSSISRPWTLRDLFTNRSQLSPAATFTVEVSEIEPLSSNWAYAYGTDMLELAEGKKETITLLVLIGKTVDGWKTFREVLGPD